MKSRIDGSLKTVEELVTRKLANQRQRDSREFDGDDVPFYKDTVFWMLVLFLGVPAVLQIFGVKNEQAN